MLQGVFRFLVYSLLFCLIAAGAGGFIAAKQSPPVHFSGQKTFDAHTLSEFNGTNPDKPIYLALDGFVYDVTAGKTFYQTGGTYHFLAGKDSSGELHVAGAGIIKRKYPVIATYIH